MNFEKIINYFRRLGQAIRTKSAGPRSKRGDKSFNERKGKLRLILSGIVSKGESRLRTG